MNLLIMLLTLVAARIVVPPLYRRRWKTVARWHHPEAGELVVLRRHRLTGTVRRVYYDDLEQFYDEWL